MTEPLGAGSTRNPGNGGSAAMRGRAARKAIASFIPCVTKHYPRDFYFFFGIFAPDLRASLNAIATACSRLLTFAPVLPDFKSPSLYSFITLRTLLCPLPLELLFFLRHTTSSVL